MMNGRRVVVVMPAYNAALTIARTHEEVLEHAFVDHVIVVDDASRDDTVARARALPRTKVLVHDINLGYGANQKTCYRAALEEGAEIVVMVHPDYQYTPRLLPALVGPIAFGVHDAMLGSRILGGRALTVNEARPKPEGGFGGGGGYGNRGGGGGDRGGRREPRW